MIPVRSPGRSLGAMSTTGAAAAEPTAYLDHAASSPMRPEALAAMADVQARVFGNPSGSHRLAREARRLLDDARDQIADAVGAEPGEVVFTSGGTEADNLALRGVAAAAGGSVACSAVEHHAVLDTVRALGGHIVAVDRSGRVDRDALADLVRSNQARAAGQGPVGGSVAVVSVMLANNETGVVDDLSTVAEVLADVAPGTVLHTDAVAAAAWLDLVKAAAPAHLVSLSAHKVGGPKGVGALVVRAGTPLSAAITGGGQERERRSGTPNAAGAVAFATALTATVADRDHAAARVARQRDRLLFGILAAVPDLVPTVLPRAAEAVIGGGAVSDVAVTPGTLHLCVPGVDREALLFLLDEGGVAASWGSSCASGASEPSYVLAAMGIGPDLSRGSLRLSLGWSTTDAEIDHAIAVIPAAIDRLRGAR